MIALDLVRLTSVMALGSGSPDIAAGLIDGPVATGHPGLTTNIRELSGSGTRAQTEGGGTASLHGTFVAGILSAKRGSFAPAICPGCTLLVRPVFSDASDVSMPSTTPEELANAVFECVDAGARVINLSLALERPSSRGERKLADALDYAAGRDVVIVAAAGNEGLVGSSVITRHPWIIPVASYDLERRPMGHSNLSSSIGRRGLGAPGAGVTSLNVNGAPRTLTGTSIAAPFVTGAIALLWSAFPTASPAEIRFAITQAREPRRTSVVPPLLDAWAAYQFMLPMQASGAGR